MGTERCKVAGARLSIADYLEPALASATPDTRSLLQALVEHRDAVLWEQSYKSEERLVGDDMLSRYGFVEVISASGPYLSDLVRAGGSVFDVGTAPTRHCGPGDAVHAVSDTPHGLHTEGEALVMLYLWQSARYLSNRRFTKKCSGHPSVFTRQASSVRADRRSNQTTIPLLDSFSTQTRSYERWRKSMLPKTGC